VPSRNPSPYTDSLLHQDIFRNRAIQRLLRSTMQLANSFQVHQAAHETLEGKKIRALNRRRGLRGREQAKAWHTRRLAKTVCSQMI
jgi:hypothetical protein